VPVILAIPKAEIPQFEASPGKKVSKTPISTDNPGMIEHICNPSQAQVAHAYNPRYFG
jgi:hypothetical protein